MQLFSHEQIDFEKWDKTILNSQYPLVFAQSFYLNATSPGWSALVEGDYESVMPVTAKRKFGIDYLAQPPFTSQLGIYGECDKQIAESFVGFLKAKYRFIEIEVNACTELAGKDKRTFVLDPHAPYSYNENTRRNIAKASRAGFLVKDISNDDVLKLSQKHFHPFLKSLKIPAAHIKKFDDLLLSCAKKNVLKIFGVFNNSDISALGVFVSNGLHALYLKGVNLNKNSGGMHLLMDHALKFYTAEGIRIFDFGGGQNEMLARFYSGFGGKPFLYRLFKYNNLPRPIKIFKK